MNNTLTEGVKYPEAQINSAKNHRHHIISVNSDVNGIGMSVKTTKPTTVSRVAKLEAQVENLSSGIDRIESLNEKIMSLLKADASSTPDNANVAVTGQGETPRKPTIYNYQTAEMSNESMGRVTATNIEKADDTAEKLGIFDVLKPIIKDVSVSAPHVKKDGSKGKSFILNFPRINEEHPLVNKEATKAQQVAEGKAMWKKVAFSGFTFTGAYYDKEAGKRVFTTYIKANNEEALLNWLKKEGVHIPKRD